MTVVPIGDSPPLSKKETQHSVYNGGPLFDNELICFVVKNRNVCNYNEYKSHKLRLIGVG